MLKFQMVKTASEQTLWDNMMIDEIPHAIHSICLCIDNATATAISLLMWPDWLASPYIHNDTHIHSVRGHIKKKLEKHAYTFSDFKINTHTHRCKAKQKALSLTLKPWQWKNHWEKNGSTWFRCQCLTILFSKKHTYAVCPPKNTIS